MRRVVGSVFAGTMSSPHQPVSLLTTSVRGIYEHLKHEHEFSQTDTDIFLSGTKLPGTARPSPLLGDEGQSVKETPEESMLREQSKAEIIDASDNIHRAFVPLVVLGAIGSLYFVFSPIDAEDNWDVTRRSQMWKATSMGKVQAEYNPPVAASFHSRR